MSTIPPNKAVDGAFDIISTNESYEKDVKKNPEEATVIADEQSLYSQDSPEKSLSDGIIIDGETYFPPTEEEIQTLSHVPSSIPFCAWVIVIVELCERFAYYGLTVPFQNYMQFGPHDSTKGALSLGQSGATGLSNFFQFWCYVTPVFSAFIADQFLGRYNTIWVSAVIYFVGILILTCTAIPSVVNSGKSLGGFVVSLIIIGLGTGGIKSNVSPLMAEQLPKVPPYVKTMKNGNRVIIDPTITTSRVYMLFYWAINLGSLSVLATTNLERKTGFVYCYLLPLCVFIIPLAILFGTKRIYKHTPPAGSIFVKVCQVFFLAIQNKFNFQAAKPSYPDTKGKVVLKNNWDDLFIDEFLRALRACKTFLFFPIYWVCYNQMTNNLISQAAEMNTGNVSNDIFQVFDSIALIIFIPICDYGLYVLLRHLRIPFRPIARITVGFMFAAASMVYASVLQAKIYQRGPCHSNFTDDCTFNYINVWIQIPAYVLIAFSEIFASITGYEYAYTKAPASMKSFITSLFLLTNAFGAILSICISSTAVDPKLTWMYAGVAITAFIAGIAFFFCFRHYDNMEDDENKLEYVRAMEEQKQAVSNEVAESYNFEKVPTNGSAHDVDKFTAAEESLRA
ncbi:plasma membrane PTR family peptide transmembrane transporter Ptr2 [Schizosaccharomyces osmophilus]|uniref:Plasma membrane PTR family peptide transmembrane transporter Ptr2 n=1 Tax=Schizosaccharomyces osmophilus TaxID=2545709 RepID=A0AAE9W5Z1_9SCHI|nr:plasma membrane PTR family peptide transmembrane transporter Ptr2 [Schizosaccharomyces osmophilus]WBW70740.1 plasma membrane PTR family peptide transmembrane transporter Ptr2 [Schizosaccharomyces osmophilus]